MAGRVIWLTGLSGSGKSTLSGALTRHLRESGRPVESLDGDEIREALPGTGFDREARDRHVRTVGFVASRLAAHDIDVVVALISPYAEARAWVRARCSLFVEVYVSTPLATCEARDTKGLYKRARRGRYDPPHSQRGRGADRGLLAGSCLTWGPATSKAAWPAPGASRPRMA